MKIAIDLRSLSSGSISGVENYCLNLLDHLLRLDKSNSYVLFYNSLRQKSLNDFHYINSQIIKTRYPNKILNLALWGKFVNLEKVIGEFDCLFMPNLNQFNILPSAKLAITVHDLSPIITPEFYNLKRRLWHKSLKYKKSFERADVIFAVSEYTKLDLLRIFGLPENKVKVVYPGIDQKALSSNLAESRLREVRNNYGLPGDYILFLNTIEPRKNLINLVKAFELLDWPGHLVIAGKTGWKYYKAFSSIRKSKKFNKIIYLGYIPEEEKSAIIKLAKVLVYPSFYEGFGFQALEAMSVGVPTITSNVTALPEVVEDASLLVNPYSVEEILTSLKTVIHNNSIRQTLIEKGSNRVKDFNWETSALQILEGLNGLV